jgi:iron complex outermembrane receptor protein
MRPFSYLLTFGLLVGSTAAYGQQPSTAAPAVQPGQDDPGTIRIRVPAITVTAEKVPEDIQTTPVSVTAVPAETLQQSAARTVSDAAAYAPNVFMHEFTARKLSNASFRGIGASPGNPGVVTYIDGVPQLNANSSSLELAGVEQIEFVRGPQSPLYGRNTVGGVINVTSARPSLSGWGGGFIAPLGNFGTVETRGEVSGPLKASTLALGFSFGYSARDGFTKNDVTGRDLDSRSAFFTKTQVLWTPAATWEARAIVTTERARDGDYALNDLGALRAKLFHAARDFEGFTNRDVLAPTVIVRRTGKAVDFSATTGIVWWDTKDVTDLDYTPLPLFTRDNEEQDVQFTQEVRVASAQNAGVSVSRDVTLQWQAGLFLFTQNYDQNAVNAFSPFVLSPLLPFPVSQRSPLAALDDTGVGVYGRGTFMFGPRLEATLGLRADHESKRADLDTSFSPAIFPTSPVKAEAAFTDVSPQLTVAYHVRPSRQMIYATAARGFKAGGFNPASPVGGEAYDQEHNWNYEGGVKTMLLQDHVSLNASAFYITWDDLQVNVPNPFAPGQYFIANAGGATSKGVEVELNARALEGCDFFASVGYTNARFGDGSVSGGKDVSGRNLKNTPAYTAMVGGQYSVPVNSRASLYGRAEITFRGAYQYDDANTQQQEAYSLSNFRAGLRGQRLFGEAWVRNAFDAQYIPTAFAFPGVAPSGFLGESGAPRTFGVRLGVTF